ncbi:MAG TPA: hypothetical protein VFX45_06115 [Solirubrobacterales bacterium]|nr:hypothetical protein [Solirubrobacterales bacterium]
MGISRQGLLGGLTGTLIAALVLSLAIASAAAASSLSLSASDAGIGGAIDAKAQLSDAPSASGEISFEVFGPGDSDCSGPALSPAPAAATVSGEGEYTSGEITPPSAGTYRWSAHYSGDFENSPADSNCSAISSVSKASPGISASASSSVVGGAIHDEATVTGGFSPSGNVVFSVYGPGDTDCSDALATSTITLQGGEATSSDFTTPQAGDFLWTAAYQGDANNKGVSTECEESGQTSTVSKASPSLSGVATAAVKVGTTITDSVTLSGGFSPGGELVFRAYGPDNASCSGTETYKATVTVSGNKTYSPPGFAPGPGVYRWKVSYEGDGNNQTDSLGCGSSEQVSTVSKAAPSLSGVATATAKVGTTITDSATLSGGFTPSGNLVFRAYGPSDPSCLGTPVYEKPVAITDNGVYSPAGFAPSAPGAYRWTVSYAGDANNESIKPECGATNQTSSVSKASPTLGAVATSVVKVGLTITDNATLSGGFAAGGQLVFRAYGPDDKTCSTPVYQEEVAVNGDGPYSPPGFAPTKAGLYRWTVSYSGDSKNDAVSTSCDADKQSSAVGMVSVVLTATATSGTIGTSVSATATLKEGAIPTGQITFKAFPPGDPSCSGGAAFSSTVGVTGNGTYRSSPFTPPRVGAFRWTVAYSGDPNHNLATVGCGKATSSISQAKPSIAGAVKQRIVVGAKFRDTATLLGGHAPGGSITFRIYGPVASGCDKPAFVDTVAIIGNGKINSDPFTALRPGRYSFLASYSGDASNQAVSEPCDSPAQVVVVQKRTPRVKPRALLIDRRRISIRASLAGSVSPTGRITFNLYKPGDKRCKRKPAFSGGVTVKANGTFPLAQYIATKRGVYRLSVGYSGDQRNQRFKGSCGGAQSIRIE